MPNRIPSVSTVDPAKNPLYGAGIHVCPGAPLASLELRVFMEELLSGTGDIIDVPEKQPVLAIYPASGFAKLYLRVLPVRAEK